MNGRLTILSHPPSFNYGGILQAYALQTSMYKLQATCETIDYKAKNRVPIWTDRSTKTRIKDFIRYIAIKARILRRPLPMAWHDEIHTAFKKQFMRLCHLNNKRTNLDNLKNCFAFIIGSDQVWRGQYARLIESLPFFFLDFATPEQRQRSIAYAASFGSDEWEGSPEETEECKRLIKDFKAVSVREHSGIRICREVFGVDAVQMPDPTLLLEQEDYNHLIRNWRTKAQKSPFMAIYLLDETEEKKALTKMLCRESGLYAQHLMPHPGASRFMDRLPLSIPQWLRFIRDSEYVLTDSFHGCVFAIIFNKPFVCLGNESRGNARFDSLMGTFGLQDRLVTNPSPETIQKLINTPIDWEKVNTIHSSERERAFDFLRTNLSSY